MKTILLVIILFIGRRCHSQGFVNMDFENASVMLAGDSDHVYANSAIPGWTAYNSGATQSVIYYNTKSLGGSLVALEDINDIFGPLPIEGDYSVLLDGPSPGIETSAAIGQTGTIPITAQSLTFFVGVHFGSLQLTFNGQNISYGAVGSGANYTIYGADISSYAGQTGQLLFTAPVNNNALLDNIQFSTTPVPEPSQFALGALGALLLGFRRWQNSSR